MACLIVAESAIFIIFIVAYVFYTGKSLSGPVPRQVLVLPIAGTICLLSSSATITLAIRALDKDRKRLFGAWWAATIALGMSFLLGTAGEWRMLIQKEGLTISSNLFGTTFYSLVGLHATHVVAGLTALGVVMLFALGGRVNRIHIERIEVLAIYWHFVDVVWVVVFCVVYLLAR
jgi:cytochrome c oxidase subunit 3/cytochrome o ubiquinol oxidase subunit 3